MHNLGEGLAIGSSLALGELALGTFLIVGFMVHNLTEGLGIAAPVAEGPARVGARLAVLALVAGGPAVLGAWIGGFLTNDLLGGAVLRDGGGRRAAGRRRGRPLRRPASPRRPHIGACRRRLLAGIAAMYATGASHGLT